MRALVVAVVGSGGGVAAARVCLLVVGGDARAPVPQKSVCPFRRLLSAPLPSAHHEAHRHHHGQAGPAEVSRLGRLHLCKNTS
jgi:hypothetical protein